MKLQTLIEPWSNTLRKKTFFHTYQLKDERAYRVVLKYLHHTTDIEEIRQDLLEQGHVARNIVNARHRTTKEPLNLLFIDLEPTTNNKTIYNITATQDKIIHFEPPRLTRITYSMHTVPALRTYAQLLQQTVCMRPAQKVKTPQQNARYVEGIIPPTTKAPRATIISSGVTTSIEPPKLVSTHNPRNLYIPASPQQPRTCADVTSNRSHVTQDSSKQATWGLKGCRQINSPQLICKLVLIDLIKMQISSIDLINMQIMLD